VSVERHDNTKSNSRLISSAGDGAAGQTARKNKMGKKIEETRHSDAI
jgi:hypothetical protein